MRGGSQRLERFVIAAVLMAAWLWTAAQMIQIFDAVIPAEVADEKPLNRRQRRQRS